MSMIDRDQLRRQYLTEERLELRSSVWHPTVDGRDPSTEVLAMVVAAEPRDVLEIGCGTGAFAARLVDALPQVAVVALDQSERFVELTTSRGVDARLGDVHDLPFDDGSFDCVAALWMLYHVADLHRGLAEVRRVLRPGGTFLAVTNGDAHIADLRREAGLEPVITQFSSENGEAALRRHFDDVTRDDLHTRAAFADADAARAYLATSDDESTWSLPDFEGPRQYAGHVTIFTAR